MKSLALTLGAWIAMSACGSTPASDIVPRVSINTLVVISNGRSLGYLLDADEFVLKIWDPSADQIFYLNDSTGFVAQRSTVYFFEDNCQGAAYSTGFEEIIQREEGRCHASGDTSSSLPTLGASPARKIAMGVGGDYLGTIRPRSVMATKGNFAEFGIRSAISTTTNANCRASGSSPTCALALEPSTLPVSFALPITIGVPTEPL